MRELAPSSAIPLADYLFAHLGLGAALLVLAVDPSLPGASFYQPRMVALVHPLTITSAARRLPRPASRTGTGSRSCGSTAPPA